MENNVTSICITGVGGQGIILASNIISKLALESGMDVKKSEIHGMSQRGGSVISEVRFGNKVYSPIVPDGSADIILSFEKMETLRYMGKLKKNGLIIVNEQEIYPAPVLEGKEKYPDDIMERLKSGTETIVTVNAVEEAKKLNNIKTVNIIILGTLSNYLPFELSLWEKVIKSSVPAKTIDINMKAFMIGRKYRNA